MPRERRDGLRPLLVRLVVSFVLSSAVMYAAGPVYVRVLLPLFAKELELVRRDYTVVAQDLDREGRSDQVRTRVRVDRDVVDDSGTLRPGYNVTVAQYSYNLYVHPIIMLTVLGAWPFRRWRDRAVALAAAVPLLLVILMLDMPFHVMYYIEKAHGAPRLVSAWFHVLGTGGRQFFSLLAAGGAVYAAGFMEERRNEHQHARR